MAAPAATVSVDSSREQQTIKPESAGEQPPAKWTGRSVTVEMEPSAHRITWAAAAVFALIAVLCFAVFSAPVSGCLALGMAALTIPLRQMILDRKITVVEDNIKAKFKENSKSKKDDFSDLPEVKFSKESDSTYVLEKPTRGYFQGKDNGKLVYLGVCNSTKIGIFVFDKDYKSATWKVALDNETIQLSAKKVLASDPEDSQGRLKIQD